MEQFARKIMRLSALLLSALLVLSGCGRVFPRNTLSPLVSDPESSALVETETQEELRGVYIVSGYNMDYPSKPDLSADQLRTEIDAIVANVKKTGLNAVYLQVRSASDALYESSIFPVSEALSSTGELYFDPLAYLIEAAHAVGVTVHAWVNPLRATLGSVQYPNTDIAAQPEKSPIRQHPEWVIAYADGKLYYDPGLPEVRELVAEGVREIVDNYDVDGILFDDYFYPYPVTDNSGALIPFDDTESYHIYGGDTALSDWRRENINQMVETVWSAIREESDTVLFGIAPFGIWQNDNGTNGGSATRGLESYHSIYCDPIAWAKGGYVDYLAPQIYWRFTTSVAPYGELVDWWNTALDGTGVDLLISHAAYNYETWTSPSGEIQEQVDFARQRICYRGSIFYGYDEICTNVNLLQDELNQVYSEELLYYTPTPTYFPLVFTSPTEIAEEITLCGISSPDKPIEINGEKISRLRGGAFAIRTILSERVNRFETVQCGQKSVYTVYYRAPDT